MGCCRLDLIFFFIAEVICVETGEGEKKSVEEKGRRKRGKELEEEKLTLVL